jgi:HSP20 family molecular chaperone IbpA
MFAVMPWKKGKKAGALLPRSGYFPLMEEFESLFGPFFRFPVTIPEEYYEKPWGLEVEEIGKEVVVRAELPGFEPGEIAVNLIGETLTIEARHEEPVKEEKKEPRFTHVRREIILPVPVEVEKAVATYRNGILEVHFPKLPEVVGKRIEVKI